MDSHFTGAPKPDKVPRPDVHRVKTTEVQVFCIVSKNIFGQYIHWYGGRSHECTQDKARCRGCMKEWPTKWLGYLDCHSYDQRARVFLELTLTAANLLADLAPADANLRGLVINVSKTKGGAKGRYRIEVKDGRKKSSELPEERDPLPTLQFLWRCKNQHVQDQPASV